MNEPIKLQYDALLASAQALVETVGPDYVYVTPDGEPADDGYNQQCLYVHNNGEASVPGCLVGTLLHSAGVPLGVMKDFEGEDAHQLITGLKEYGILADIPGKADEFLQFAQARQDVGTTWANAVSQAADWVEKGGN